MLGLGAAAPDFTLKNQHGASVSLSALGGRSVLLVFFPLAFTPICAGELGEIQDNPDIYGGDAVTLAISVGPPPTHKVWAAQSGFTFDLLSDFWPHGAVAQQYGVFNEASGCADRGTFVVDGSGIVRFAECKESGVPRDPADWRAALAALRI